jgi:integrase
MGKLTATKVQALKEPGRYADGDGLYFWIREHVSPKTGARSITRGWVLRVQKQSRRRDISLGSYPVVSLQRAREKALEIHQQLERGLDPVAERKREAVMTFRAAAQQVYAEHQKGWRNGKHKAQWLSSLEPVFAAIGDKTLDTIETGHIRDLLAPMWLEKPETARRTLQRIAVVCDWGFSKGWRPAELPRRSIVRGLPKQPKRDGHFAAMPFDQVPAFVERLREREGISRLALEAVILTACRSGEIRGATWDEVDLEAALWTIPGERMKAGKEHVVPLSPAAVDVFRRALPYRRRQVKGRPDLCFPGMLKGQPLSDMALTQLLRNMDVSATAHGFRSSFRDWVAERTNFPGEVAEMALAHAIGSKVEAAYRRGNLLEKRRQMMDAWARFVTSESAKVVPIAGGVAA